MTATLEALVADAASAAFWNQNAADAAVPFGDVAGPIAEWALARLLRAAGPSAGLLTAEAQRKLALGLMRTLAHMAAPCLYAEFSAMRAAAVARKGHAGSRGIYAGFLARLRSGGLARFFEDYPVLAHGIAVRLAHWVEAHAELLARLETDQAALGEAFGAWSRVVDVEPELSDPHHRGRTVCGLTLDHGRRLIYKPRPIGMEAAFHALLDWTAWHGADWGASPHRVLPRGPYGWSERVEAAWPQPGEPTRRFHRRNGMLLGLFYALGTTDIHHENLVPTPEGFVLVDMETLFSPTAFAESRDLEEARDAWTVTRALGTSVLQVGMVSGWFVDAEGRWWSNSPLDHGAAASATRPGWHAIGQDAMRPAEVPNEAALSAVPPPDSAAIAEGFEAMVSLLRRHREALLADDGPLRAFQGQTLRFVRRDSLVYGALLDAWRRPALARDWAAARREHDRLALAHRGEAFDPREGPLVDAERQALADLDLPHFHADADGTTLYAAGMPPQRDFWSISGLEAVRLRLGALTERDQQSQAACLRQALALGPRLEAPPVMDLAPRATASSGAELRAAARRLGEFVATAAIPTAHGRGWLTLGAPSAARSQGLAFGAPGLYDGAAGSALALAALAAVEDDAASASLALDALAPLRAACASRVVRRGLATKVRHLESGLAAGLYAFTVVGSLLDVPELHQEALALALALEPDDLVDEQRSDVLYGLAGLSLSLLALQAVRPDAGVLERAAACGDRLLAMRAVQPDGRGAWLDRAGRVPGAGFAHGQAGIAYALARLGDALGRPDFRAAAQEAFAHEASTLEFSTDSGWLTQSMTGWCNGAPGLALGRVGAGPAYVRPASEAVSACLRETAERPAGVLTVCCGLFGRVDVLLSAAHRLDSPDLEVAARALAASGLSRLEDYRPGADRLMPGGFFRGLAGIVYQLVRLSAPERIPSVLLVEPPGGLAHVPRHSAQA